MTNLDKFWISNSNYPPSLPSGRQVKPKLSSEMTELEKSHPEESIGNLSLQMQFDQLKRDLISELKSDLKKVSKPTSKENLLKEPPFI